MTPQDFSSAGFSVSSTPDNSNKLIDYLKANFPGVIKDGEINLSQLKAVAGLPVDTKVNGYGLSFIGRNYARAKYVKKTDKELQLNTKLSKDINSTGNLVLKGDNLDSLKLLKSHYSNKIKCIYIDPPYNTTSDNFIYPDKFDKEEAEVLGMTNLSEDDYARLDFSFKTKKSHNGWLAFMYPRLLLARDLLTDDGVIFISIDDNEQANLKLLCDDIFGEENFVANLPTVMNLKGNNDEFGFAGTHEYTLVYSKNKTILTLQHFEVDEDEVDEWQEDENGYYKQGANLKASGEDGKREKRPNLYFPVFIDSKNNIYVTDNDLPPDSFEGKLVILYPKSDNNDMRWRWSKEKFRNQSNDIIISRNGSIGIYKKQRPSIGDLPSKKPKTLFYKPEYSSGNGTSQIKNLLGDKFFSNPKPLSLIQDILQISSNKDSIILDFFAGSGTTGHAVMELNKDGGNRKFILCQIDEPIAVDKPAYQFCIDNNLEPVISSITIERLNRAGAKIIKELEESKAKSDLFANDEKAILDVGYKVFDTKQAPKLELSETGEIIFPVIGGDTISRIYNMILTIGLDEPTQIPEEVVADCVYKIGTNYYLTSCDKISTQDFSSAIKNGKVFIDGWTASLSGTLQNFKDNVEIVF